MTENRWQNRIIGHGEEDPAQLLGHPLNARIHPLAQQKAVTSLLDTVGWVAEVIVNQRTGFIVDGHLRVAEAISADEATVPCAYVDLSDEEERLVVAFYDGTGSMAVVDPTIFIPLTEDLVIPEPLQGLARELGQLDADTPGGGGDDLPPAESDMTWGYATFGKTRVGCSVAEVDAIHKLWEDYKAANGGEDAGFVRWLAGTDRLVAS